MEAERLIGYCYALQRKMSDLVGHLHKPALLKYAQSGRVFPAFENEELCGYLLFSDDPTVGDRWGMRRWGTARIYQAAIQYDAQRIRHGTELVERLVKRARARRCIYVDCLVTDWIPANAFWTDMGFEKVGTRPGRLDGGRVLNHYRRSLCEELMPGDVGQPVVDVDTPLGRLFRRS